MSKSMNEHQVIIDTEKCIGCGLCKSDCVGMDIDIEDGKAFARGKRCIICGHCEAICPNAAITITGFKDEVVEYKEQTRLDPETLLNAIKTRRTIRQFTDQKIPKEVLEMIFEAGRLAPTGSNAQEVRYVLLDKKKSECEAVAVDMFNKLLSKGKRLFPGYHPWKLMNIFSLKKLRM